MTLWSEVVCQSILTYYKLMEKQTVLITYMANDPRQLPFFSQLQRSDHEHCSVLFHNPALLPQLLPMPLGIHDIHKCTTHSFKLLHASQSLICASNLLYIKYLLEHFSHNSLFV